MEFAGKPPSIMRVRYPTSFLKLLLFGFGLAALPLVIAIVDAYSSLERLMKHSEHAVTRAVQLTRESRSLSEQLTVLERSARQQLVLTDPAGLDAYAVRRKNFLETIQHLGQEAPSTFMHDGLTELINSENTIWQHLRQTPLQAEDNRIILDTFNLMAETCSKLLSDADSRIEADVKALRIQAEQARHDLILRLLGLVPIGLLLLIAVTYMIRRPIRQIAAAIRSLGEGRFDQSISVRGPRDLEILGNELNWLRLRLNEVETQKTRFLQHMSHELKTPLTAIYEGTQLISDNVAGVLNEAQREIVGILRENTVKLRQLIEALLDYSAIRFHPAALRLEPIALAGLFEQIANDQKLALTSRQLTLQSNADGLSIDADREKLRIVLDNLISNAVKYAPQNSQIDLTAAQDSNAIIIEVADTGPGIAEAEEERLFEPFVQGAQPKDAPIKGTGLGLSIVKEFVNAHGGEVTLMRNVPNGTRVRVRLPHPVG